VKFNIYIEVKSPDFVPPKNRSNDGRNGCVVGDQFAWVDLGNSGPQKIRIPIALGEELYPTGTYLLDPLCLYVDRNGYLSLDAVRLLQIVEPARA
jgi:Helix-destabilising protein